MKNFFKIYKSVLLEKRSKSVPRHWPEKYIRMARNTYLRIVDKWPENYLNKDIYTDEEKIEIEKAENFANKLKDKFEKPFITDNKNTFIKHQNEKLFNPIARMIAELIKENPQKQIYNQNGDLDCKELDFIFSKLDFIITKTDLYNEDFIKKFSTWSFKVFKDQVENQMNLGLYNSKLIKSGNAVDVISKNPKDYDVFFIENYEQFNELCGGEQTGNGSIQTIWCTANSLWHYNTYLKKNPSLRFVVLALKGWENITYGCCLKGENIKEHNPYDLYGLSLVNFTIDLDSPDLNFTNSCIRYNHLGDFHYSKTKVPNKGGDFPFLTWDDVKDVYHFDVRKLIEDKLNEYITSHPNSSFSIYRKNLKTWIYNKDKANESIANKLANNDNERLFLSDFERKNVSEINIPNIDIGQYFSECPRLKKVTLDDKITIIPEQAFANDVRLKEIKLSNNLEQIKFNAFLNCKMLSQKIILPDSIKRIWPQAFANSGIQGISFPDNISKIEAGCFAQCYWLLEINLPKKLKNIEDFAFAGCANFTNIKLPDTLITIGNKAFAQCLELREIEIPASVQNIGIKAFYLTPELKRVTFLGTPQRLKEKSFMVQPFEFEGTKTGYLKEIIAPQKTLDNFSINYGALYYNDSMIDMIDDDYPIKFTLLK